MNGYELPLELEQQIEDLNQCIKDYQAGKIDKIKFKAVRVPFGIYEQRKENTYMVRIRCAGGFITPAQLKKCAELSSFYGRKTMHITTRQELQIHNVQLDNIIPVLKALKSVGLSAKGGGGNTVRNIIAPADAGINPDELFDVSPYVFALTSRLLTESDSYALPRKYKIAFSGTKEDRAHATVSDLGFIARIKEGKKGFAVYCAGGMGAKSSEGKLLFDFVEDNQVYSIARAVKNLFNQHGNRKNKHAARLRFLWDKLGEKQFKELLAAELKIINKNSISLDINKYQAEKLSTVKFKPVKHNICKDNKDKTNHKLWENRYVSKQNDDNYTVLIPVFLGELDNSTALKLADFLNQFTTDTLRFTLEGNVLLRNIPSKYLNSVYEFLTLNFTDSLKPLLSANIVSCTGAATCQLGICLSQELAKQIRKTLETSSNDLDRLPKDFNLHISGCPNSCGQHYTADLGFYGMALRKEENLYPAYAVVAGSKIENEQIIFGKKIMELAVKDLPVFIEQILSDYISYLEYQTHPFAVYLEKKGFAFCQALKDKYSLIPRLKDNPDYYYDFGAQDKFSLAKRSQGECSASLFDFIERDLSQIQKYTKLLADTKLNDQELENYLYQTLLSSSRMLLITRGIEAAKDKDIFKAFSENFIETGLIADSYADLLKNISIDKPALLKQNKDNIMQMSIDVIELYNRMDDSLNFESLEKVKNIQQAKHSEKKPEIFKDLRGVACPMNFVKTKMELAKLKSGALLEIFLDNGSPIENVPKSVTEEGHKVLSQEKIENYWKVVIQKK